MSNQKLKKKWADAASTKLVGRKITAVRYMTVDEVKSFYWCKSAIVITLDDGTLFYPLADDEGNDAGAITTNCDDLPIIPVI